MVLPVKRNLYGLMMKFPEPGRVKTRLAREIGEAAAADVCRRVTETVLAATAGSPCYGRVVFFSPKSRLKDFAAWMPREELVPQRGSGLGGIMANCLGELFRRGADKAVITGSDIPALDRRIIEDAFLTLDGTDLVLGPARDGGYYLAGMKRPNRSIFEGISYGGNDVFVRTTAAAEREGLSWGTVAVLDDLDTLADLERLDRWGLLRNSR
ncbi:MAG: TIGR04282 family arsenosugar biosynthesis glycosyltransferase [Thermodesulfovibrionales bacterium]